MTETRRKGNPEGGGEGWGGGGDRKLQLHFSQRSPESSALAERSLWLSSLENFTFSLPPGPAGCLPSAEVEDSADSKGKKERREGLGQKPAPSQGRQLLGACRASATAATTPSDLTRSDKVSLPLRLENRRPPRLGDGPGSLTAW